MNENELNPLEISQAYVNGLLHMASCCSDWIGRSEITAACYSVLNGENEFAADFGFLPDMVRLVPDTITFRQSLARWLGGKNAKLNDSLCWLIGCKLGGAEQVFRFCDEDAVISGFGCGEGGYGPYYFIEDMFFVRFEKAFVCFFMGNNE